MFFLKILNNPRVSDFSQKSAFYFILFAGYPKPYNFQTGLMDGDQFQEFEMTKKQFKTTLTQSGAQVRLPVPFDPNEVWGEKQRHHIRGTVNGMPFRGPMASDESGYFLVLGAAWRRDCGLAAGNDVHVILEPEGPQLESLAPDLSAALAAEPEARAFFDSLATFYRKGYLRWIEGAKRPETREKRIRETIELLKDGKKQR